MHRIMICGIGTDVGKTLVSAIFAEALDAHYWKPVQAGNLEASDTQTVKRLVPQTICYPEAYRLLHPLSPHFAAVLEGVEMNRKNFIVPQSNNPLVIEAAGGVLVPYTQKDLLVDLFIDWQCEWVVVSRHYVGSINHTLLTLEALQRRGIYLKGIIFNGSDQPQCENVILSHSGLTCLGHLYPESQWTPSIIKRYASAWKSRL